MIRKTLFFIIAATLFPVTTFAQNSLSENDSLAAISLPPIEKLFAAVENNAAYKYYDARKAAEERILRTEKRRWLNVLSVFGTYQYGVMGMNSYYNEGTGTPIINQYSGADQMWYNFGAAIRIPFDLIFDRRNKIKLQKERINEAEYSKQQWIDSYKTKVIEYYSKSEEMLYMLKYSIEQATLSDAQYTLAQKDYIAGSSTSQTLTVAKSQQVQAHTQLARVKAELVNCLLQLELLTNTDILF